MADTNIKIRSEKISNEVQKIKSLEWTVPEKSLTLNRSPFPSVESVLGDIEECMNARNLFAQRQS